MKPLSSANRKGSAARMAAALLFIAHSALGAGAQGLPASIPSAVDDICHQFSSRISGFDSDQCKLAGLHPAVATSTLGRPLLVRDLSIAGAGGPARRVLVLGGIHGDELS